MRMYNIITYSPLETTKTKRDMELITSDDHFSLIKSMKKSLEDYRPDVTHQVIYYIFI